MTISNLTYRQKNIYGLIGAVLFLVVVYFAVIGRTLDLYKANKELHKKALEAENAPEKREQLKKKMERINEVLSPYIADSIRNREYILSAVSEFCQHYRIVLKEFPSPVISSEKDFDIETNIVVAEGNFTNLLKLVYELEQKNKIARPVSVNFQKLFDYKTKREVLTLTLYLQNIRLKKNEDGKG